MTNKDIGDNLWQLYEVLHGCAFCKDLSALSKASNDCLQNNRRDFWEFDVAKLLFEIDKYNVLPIHVEDIELEFSITAKGKVGSQEFLSYGFNIVVIGSYLNQSYEIEKAVCSWHFDLHNHSKPGVEDKFLHPRFHFQHGGKNIKPLQNELGKALVMASPRIAHPPMDATLGIDFILTNFVHRDKAKSVRENSAYRRLLKEAQLAYWKPYFDSIASIWTTSPSTEGFAFHPQLIS